MSSSEPSFDDACPSENAIVELLCGQLAPEPLGRLLAHAEHCSACALIVVEAGLAFSGHSAPRAVSVFAAGQLVASRYLIERCVGRGGMGEIYSALDQEFGDRVALKTICSGFASDLSSVDRFKLELRLARRISHPNVCRVFEFGRHELSPGVSQCFFTLQFIEGVTLRQRLLEAGRLDLSAGLRLARQLALGLEAIHGQNVVHRDIKPENVMLPAKPSATVGLWVDFGLARADLRESRSGGVLAGTPDYAAPELLVGGIASRRSDLYAFGVMMHELFTGARPLYRTASFAAARDRSRTRLRAPSELCREIPPELDALVLACLQEAPELRPASAAHVAARLRAIESASQRFTTRRSAVLSLAIAAAGAALAVYHTAIAEDAAPELTRVAELNVTSAAPTAVAPSAESSGVEFVPPPPRMPAPKRAAPTSTPAAGSAKPSVPPTLRTLPDFGGRR